MAMYTTAISGVTSGTALKTIIQVAASAANKAEVVEWSLSFNGTNAAAVPVLVQLNRQTTAGTGGVAGNRNPHDTSEGASTTTSLTGPLAAVWTGEPTTGLIMYADYFTPVGLGPFIQYPLGRGIVLPLSGRLGITVTAAVAVSCAGHITWIE
jgi:hypothetical protein